MKFFLCEFLNLINIVGQVSASLNFPRQRHSGKLALQAFSAYYNIFM